MKTSYMLACIAIATILAGPACAAPKYKADVPASVVTPDNVQSEYLGSIRPGVPAKSSL